MFSDADFAGWMNRKYNVEETTSNANAQNALANAGLTRANTAQVPALSAAEIQERLASAGLSSAQAAGQRSLDVPSLYMNNIGAARQLQGLTGSPGVTGYSAPTPVAPTMPTVARPAPPIMFGNPGGVNFDWSSMPGYDTGTSNVPGDTSASTFALSAGQPGAGSLGVPSMSIGATPPPPAIGEGMVGSDTGYHPMGEGRPGWINNVPPPFVPLPPGVQPSTDRLVSGSPSNSNQTYGWQVLPGEDGSGGIDIYGGRTHSFADLQAQRAAANRGIWPQVSDSTTDNWGPAATFNDWNYFGGDAEAARQHHGNSVIVEDEAITNSHPSLTPNPGGRYTASVPLYSKGTANVLASPVRGSLVPHEVLKATNGATKVPGKGDGKTDTQPSMLAPGEAVLNKAAAEHLGRDTITLLNALGRKRMGIPDQDPNQPGQGAPQGFRGGTSKVPMKRGGKADPKAASGPASKPPGAKGKSPSGTDGLTPGILQALMGMGGGAPPNAGMPPVGPGMPGQMPMAMPQVRQS